MIVSNEIVKVHDQEPDVIAGRDLAEQDRLGTDIKVNELAGQDGPVRDLDGPPEVIVITGPTGSGKTASAIQLAEELDGEIISADSMQIYRGLDIGTAKATRAEQAAVPHHMIDIISVQESFSVADYQERALACIKEIRSRGKLPIVCGGTGQYIQALTEGLTFHEIPRDDELRSALQERVRNGEIHLMMDELRRLDPATAERLHPNNVKRVIRALEVCLLTGKTQTELNAASRQGAPAHRYLSFVITHQRPVLYERIDRRVLQMLEAGLLDEARWLMDQQLPEDATCLQAIGYKEVIPYLKGETDLDSAVLLLQRSSRRYAKRQLTWFRSMQGLQWISDLSAAEVSSVIVQTLHKYV